MISFLVLAVLQASVYKFDLGPIHFSLSADRKWTLDAFSREVDIDLDRLVIRALKPGEGWSPGVLPFRGQGILSLGSKAQAVNLEIWPPEWSSATVLRAEYEARRPDYLWHERRDVLAVNTPSIDTSIPKSPRRLIFFPTSAPAPKFAREFGGPYSPKQLQYKLLTLVKSDSAGALLKVEGLDQKLLLPLGELTHPWLQPVLSQIQTPGKNVWLPFFNVEAADGGTINLAGKPAVLKGAYVLGYPRSHDELGWHITSEVGRLCFEPVVATLEIANSHGIVIRSLLLPSTKTFFDLFRFSGPELDFPLRRRESFPAKVTKGMTPTQVWWILGPPISKEFPADKEEIWTYRQIAPIHVIRFDRNKVVEIQEERLP